MDFSALNEFSPLLRRVGIISAEKALKPQEHYGLRLTEEYELDLITGGSGGIQIGENQYPASYGMLFFRHPGVETDGWGSYCCYHFRFLFQKGAPLYSPKLPLPDTVRLKAPESSMQECRVLYEGFLNADPALSFLTNKCLSALLYECCRTYGSNNQSAASQLSADLIHYIQKLPIRFEAAPEACYSLDTLCAEAHVSKFFFCRAFKSVTGETVIGCLNRLRIRHAQRLLLESRLSVQEIQFASGFESSAQFFGLFKRQTGHTPKQYRDAFSIK